MRLETRWPSVVAMALSVTGCTGALTEDLFSDASPPIDATTFDEPTGVGNPVADATRREENAIPPPVVVDAGAGEPPPADAGEDGDRHAVEASSDAQATDEAPPQSGPFLDGSCPYDASASLDGGTPPATNAPDAHVPQYHRAAALCCPVDRAPGSTCEPDAAMDPSGCIRDSDCTQGTNGRCLVLPYLQPGTGLYEPDGAFVVPGIFGCMGECTYDQCFSDQDCPGHVPCDCRTPLFFGNMNLCVTGSQCSVDSDCGPGGFCTFSGNAYFCHQPSDVCFNDSDCPQGTWGATCKFDTGTSHWICNQGGPPAK
jgi:hypothetical protein